VGCGRGRRTKRKAGGLLVESGLAAKVSVNLADDDRRRSDEMMGWAGSPS